MSSFTAKTNSTNNNRKVLEFADWNPKSHKYMVPKANDKGGKSVTLISTQTNKSLHLNTPLLMTWGISDFANDDGTSDGKFKITLNFPNEEYKTEDTTLFLNKITEFQNQIVDDAVTNSELWFGKKKSKELVEDSFFPFIKYPKIKDSTGKSTGNIDTSKAPSFGAKVPCYPQDDGIPKWDCDLFNSDYNQIFPNEDDSVTPPDLVPKLSKIACTLQCTGIWVGGKGWGLTWKFISGVVIPKIQESIRGKCHIRINPNEMNNEIEKGLENEEDPTIPVQETVSAPAPAPVPTPVKKPESLETQTFVENSDDEEEAPVAPAPPVATQTAPKVVKKIIKKKV